MYYSANNLSVIHSVFFYGRRLRKISLRCSCRSNKYILTIASSQKLPQLYHSPASFHSLTLKTPRVVMRSSGMTGSAVKLRVIKGSMPSRTPAARAAA